MDTFDIHPSLSYSQHDIPRNVFAPEQHWPIIWDLREPPHYARQVSNPEESPCRLELSQHATRDPVKSLRIQCDDFPETWPVQVVRDDEGITLGDVLSAIHSSLKTRLSAEEYERLPRRQQLKVKQIFEQRCRGTNEEQRNLCRDQGIIRMDCLLDRVWFGGLVVSPNALDSWILSLRQYPPVDFSSRTPSPSKSSPLIWDLREPPHRARRAMHPQESPSPLELSQLATSPPLTTMNIVCDIFPESWPIEIRQTEYITLEDVLEAIYTTLGRKITRELYDSLKGVKRERVKAAYTQRCNMGADEQERELRKSRGVTRIDCLLDHTLFAGLSVYPGMDRTCILTLRKSRT